MASSADITHYFKKVHGKSSIHSMRKIDFIYLINLDQRPEKLQSCIQQLTPYGIFPCRFSAVNGWELSLKDINDLGLKLESWMISGQLGSYYPIDSNGQRCDERIEVIGRTYFYNQVAPGAIGCVLSHLSILQDAYDSGYETIWIMEDDIEIIKNPHLLSDLIENLDLIVGKEGWDILFTDQDAKGQDGNYVQCFSHAERPNFSPMDPHRFSQKILISPDFKQIGARYGSYSMIIRRSGMEKLLEFIKTYYIFLPYDMEYTLPHAIRLFSVIADIVSTQPTAPTDNGKPDYKKSLDE